MRKTRVESNMIISPAALCEHLTFNEFIRPERVKYVNVFTPKLVVFCVMPVLFEACAPCTVLSEIVSRFGLYKRQFGYGRFVNTMSHVAHCVWAAVGSGGGGIRILLFVLLTKGIVH